MSATRGNTLFKAGRISPGKADAACKQAIFAMLEKAI